MKRGDVYWAEFNGGRRPVVVVSHDAFNENNDWRAITVVPISIAATNRRGPTIVALPPGAGSLPKPGIAVCHQLTTLDRARLLHRIGALAPDYLDSVDAAIKAALDLE